MPSERLADAVRRLIDASVRRDATGQDVEAAARQLEEIVTRLERFPESQQKTAELPDMENLQMHFGNDPVIGARNPIAPPVDVWIDGDTVRGRVTFGRPYEGPPGYVHGAVIAGVFDLMCGLANLAAGNAGMTGSLTVRYEHPTSLYREIAIEAKAEGTEGRKTSVGARFLDGDTVTAHADAVFVSLGPARASEYFSTAG